MTTPEEFNVVIQDAITECKSHEVQLKPPHGYGVDWDCEGCKYEFVCDNLETMVCDWY